MDIKKNPEQLIGKELGKYKVVQFLGQGGFGSSFVGISDKGSERVVKIFDKLSTSDLESMVRLDHKTVVRVDDVVDVDGSGALVLEYMRNGNLASLMRNSAFDVSDISTAVPIIRQLLGTLAEYHHLGIASGNVKLTNVLFDNNYNVKLSDMGLASFLPPKSEILDYPAFLQTLRYRDKSSGTLEFVDDVYAVGGILNQLLTRRSPEDFTTRSPIKGNVEVSNTLNHIVRTALDPDRNKRYESADEFFAALSYISAPKVIVPNESLLDLDGGKKRDTAKVILPVSGPVYVSDPTVELPSAVASDTVKGMAEPDDIVIIEPKSHDTVKGMADPDLIDDESEFIEQPRQETQRVILPVPVPLTPDIESIVDVHMRNPTRISMWSALGWMAVSALSAIGLRGCDYVDFKESPAIVSPEEYVSPSPLEVASPSAISSPSPTEFVTPSPTQAVSSIPDTYGVRVVSRFRFGYTETESSHNRDYFLLLLRSKAEYGREIKYAISLDAEDGVLDGFVDPVVLKMHFNNAFPMFDSDRVVHSDKNLPSYEFSKTLLFDSASLRPYFLTKVTEIPINKSLIISHAEDYYGKNGIFDNSETEDFLRFLRTLDSKGTDVMGSVVPSEVPDLYFFWVAQSPRVEVPIVISPPVEIPIVVIPKEEFIAYLTASFEFDVVSSEQKSIVHSLNYLRGGDMFNAIAFATDVDTNFEKLLLALHLDGLDGSVDDLIRQSSMSSFILNLPDKLRSVVYAAIPSIPAGAAEEFDLVLPENRMSFVASERFVFYSEAERDAFYSLIDNSSGWKSYGNLLNYSIAHSGDGIFDGNEFSNLEKFLSNHLNYKLLDGYPTHFTSGAVESESDWVENHPSRVSGVRKYFILKVSGNHTFLDEEGNPSSKKRDLFVSYCTNNTDELISAQMLDGKDGFFDGVVQAAYLSEFVKSRVGVKNSNTSDIGDGSSSNDLYIAIKFYDKLERDSIARSLKSLNVSSGTLLHTLFDPTLNIPLNYVGLVRAYDELIELQKKQDYKSKLADDAVKP